nr:uncharacterized protein LOC116806960 [Taeniopygia guttata]
MVDHLTHYVEAFPTSRATANQVTKVLLEHIIPRYGVPEVIDSDRGTHFVSKIVRDLTESLGIKWEYHTPWHPQSSGKVERMNGEIKTILTKLMIETKLSWIKCLPMALLILRTRPRADVGISAFEMVYGMSYRIESPQTNVLIRDRVINEYVSQLAEHRNQLWEHGLIVQRPPLDLKIHKVKPGDWILIKVWKEETLKPNWEGPYLVLLTTETAVRTAERGWTHASRIKGPVTRPHWKVISTPVQAAKWEAYVNRQKSRNSCSPEEFPCCREDVAPRDSKQPSRRARQKRNRLWRKKSEQWDAKAGTTELPQDW